MISLSDSTREADWYIKKSFGTGTNLGLNLKNSGIYIAGFNFLCKVLRKEIQKSKIQRKYSIFTLFIPVRVYGQAERN
jgi:hypothetical protein